MFKKVLMTLLIMLLLSTNSYFGNAKNETKLIEKLSLEITECTDYNVLYFEAFENKIAGCALVEMRKHDLPLHFIYAVINTESGGDVDNLKINHKAYNKNCKAIGVMQITPICLKEFNNITNKQYTEDDMWNINKNLEVGCWYLARCRDNYLKYQDDITLEDIYLCYNVGPKSYWLYRDSYYNGLDEERNCEYNALERFSTVLSIFEVA